MLFESFIHHELTSYLSYSNKKGLSYWRSTSQFEVDFILFDQIAIEVKGKSILSNRDLKGLLALREERLLKEYIVISLEDEPRVVDGITILPWETFLRNLWSDVYQ